MLCNKVGAMFQWMPSPGQDNTFAQYNQIQPNTATMYPQQYQVPGVVPPPVPGLDGQAQGGLIQRVKEGIPQTCGDIVLSQHNRNIF